MMESVYVIKVKTKPPLSSLYPSERRYSASTVGGLSLVHFGLGVLSLLLGTLALSLQGPILSVACMVPFVTGLLAWRRWYINRNIAIFFYGSLFSLIAAILCFVLTILDITAASDSTGGSMWSLKTPNVQFHHADNVTNMSAHVRDIVYNSLNVTKNDESRLEESIGSPVTSEPFSIELNMSDYHDDVRNGSYDNLKAEASLMFEEKLISREVFQDEDAMNITQKSTDLTKDETDFWKQYENSSHTRMLLTFNVLMASLLEIFWSLLSAKIAFRGMMSPDSGNIIAGSKTVMRLPVQKRKPPAPKPPDILDHDRRLSDNPNFNNLHGLTGPGARLPLPESSKEFRERVERFLANQATQRIVEGA
ncbi:uncharacterized protein LOC109858503 [Pseudomyrmex gracilis]|uniref:uncharacterized protein LOC109858503 n=1 Tax=Pseudomyrmex gracilis TaxID=219809 RepID=UPI000995319F|nr:uncharacterized protein LOC109858503 [Pseudomyrmex gracilis]